jgi:hypothetical protein
MGEQPVPARRINEKTISLVLRNPSRCNATNATELYRVELSTFQIRLHERGKKPEGRGFPPPSSFCCAKRSERKKEQVEGRT